MTERELIESLFNKLSYYANREYYLLNDNTKKLLDEAYNYLYPTTCENDDESK